MSNVPPPAGAGYGGFSPPAPQKSKTPWGWIIGIMVGVTILGCAACGLAGYGLSKNPQIMDAAMYSEKPSDEEKVKRVLLLKTVALLSEDEIWPEDVGENEQTKKELLPYISTKIEDWAEDWEKPYLKGDFSDLEEWELTDLLYGYEEGSAILWSMGLLAEMPLGDFSENILDTSGLSDEKLKRLVDRADDKGFTAIEKERKKWAALAIRSDIEWTIREGESGESQIEQIKEVVGKVEQYDIDIPIRDGDLVFGELKFNELSEDELDHVWYLAYARNRGLSWCLGFFYSYGESYGIGIDGYMKSTFEGLSDEGFE